MDVEPRLEFAVLGDRNIAVIAGVPSHALSRLMF
jgi:hypothetical protein